MRIGIILFYLLQGLVSMSQNNCDESFVKDTLSLPREGKVIEGEYLETTLKNQSVVKLFKTNDHHYYLKLIVSKNFYFDKVDVLEIKSGSKSYYAKGSKQHKINKTSGLFVIEIFQNYVYTLKESGITGIVFGNTETDFTREDAEQVKKISKCFYEAIAAKKANTKPQ